METKGTANESNLPEKGAESVNGQSVNNENDQEFVNENVEDLGVTKVVETQSAEESPEKEAVEDTVEEEVVSAEIADESVEKGIEEEKVQVDDEVKKVDEAKEVKVEIPEFSAEDYTECDRPALLAKLNSLINNYDIEVIRDAVEEIKTVFYKKYKAEVAEARKDYVEKGGVIENY